MKKLGNFEQLIDQKTLRVYAKRNSALIHKVPTPTAGKNGSLKYTKKSTVDFIGITSDGEFIAIECKETKHEVLPMDMIHKHQIDYLMKVQELGGIAFFLIKIGEANRVFMLHVSGYIYYNHWAPRIQFTIPDLEKLGTELSDWKVSDPPCDFLRETK